MLCFVVIFCVHCRRNYGRTTFYCNLVFYLSFLCNFTIFTFLNGKIYLHIREEMEIDVCNESAPIHLVSQIPFNYTLKVNITIAVCAAAKRTCWWKLNWGRLPDVLRIPLEWHLLSSEQKNMLPSTLFLPHFPSNYSLNTPIHQKQRHSRCQNFVLVSSIWSGASTFILKAWMFDTLHFRQRYGRTTFYTTVILYLSYLFCLTAYTSIMGKAYSALFEEHNLTSCQSSIFSQSNSSKSKFGFHTVPDNFTVKAGILIVVYGDQPVFVCFPETS